MCIHHKVNGQRCRRIFSQETKYFWSKISVLIIVISNESLRVQVLGLVAGSHQRSRVSELFTIYLRSTKGHM